MSIDQKELDLLIEGNINVLFVGKHGVGKTAIVREAFERHNLNWRYFSSSTMDPWVDFVGIPKEAKEDNGDSYVELIRPRGFNEVEAIFLDEFNRSKPKVRNAVMELLQFRSINGVPFPNLRFIWAAINPDEEEDSDTKYDVEVLDPAQRDRFEVEIEIPYQPSIAYFRKEYGAAGEGAVEWWNGLKEADRELISPRRLEYAIKIWKLGGSVRLVLRHKSLNASKLITLLDQGSIRKRIDQLMKGSDEDIAEACNDINFVTNGLPYIERSRRKIERFGAHIPKDILADTIAKGTKQSREIVDVLPDDIIDPIMESLGGTLTKRKMTSLAKKVNYDTDKIYGSPTLKKIESGTEELVALYKKTVTADGSSGSHQRQNAIETVQAIVESNLLPTNSTPALIMVMMVVSAVVARTQWSTLNRGNHVIVTGCTRTMETLKLRAREMNMWPTDIWDLTKAELTATGRKKQYVSGKGSGKVFTQEELDKIEEFLFNSVLRNTPSRNKKAHGGTSISGRNQSGWTLNAMKRIAKKHSSVDIEDIEFEIEEDMEDMYDDDDTSF